MVSRRSFIFAIVLTAALSIALTLFLPRTPAVAARQVADRVSLTVEDLSEIVLADRELLLTARENRKLNWESRQGERFVEEWLTDHYIGLTGMLEPATMRQLKRRVSVQIGNLLVEESFEPVARK